MGREISYKSCPAGTLPHLIYLAFIQPTYLVEFSYPIDSRKNPMIQLSDLVALCVRRFLEIEKNYKPSTPDSVKTFYAECFNTIDKRVKGRRLVERNGRNLNHLNKHLADVQCKPRTQWRRAYGIQRN